VDRDATNGSNGVSERTVIFYHRTNAAEAILREGFRDRNGLVGAHCAGIEGVFLSNFVLDGNEGAKGNQLLEVTLPDKRSIARYELIEDGKTYREWCVPARIINQHGTVRLIEDDDESIPDQYALW
jgi:hypothetical protein